jgi:hypothetical protein
MVQLNVLPGPLVVQLPVPVTVYLVIGNATASSDVPVPSTRLAQVMPSALRLTPAVLSSTRAA